MQCPNCHFENMPGNASCGRCGTSLRLATAVIDVHPPRAGKWTKRFRRLSMRRRMYGMRDVLATNLPSITPTAIDVPAGSLLVRLIVPGWAQIHMGRRGLGKILLGGFLFFSLVAAVFIGTDFGSLMLGLAVACHLASIVDLVNHTSESLGQRIVTMLSCSAMVVMIGYFPLGWGLSRFVVPQVFGREAPPFATGDVILYAPGVFGWPAVGPGDVVYYSPEQVMLAPVGHTQTIIRGDRIDRILAGPGQKAKWSAGRLEIDGEASELTPLNPARCPYSFTMVVPEGRYLILPSSLDVLPAGGLDVASVERLSIVTRGRIRGRVYLRTHPFSRFGWIR